MSKATFDEARTQAEGKRQVAQAEAEVAFNAAMAELHKSHRDNHAIARDALDEAKPLGDDELTARLSALHEAGKRPADTRPIFEARGAAYAAADRQYQEVVAALGAEHGILTGTAPVTRG